MGGYFAVIHSNEKNCSDISFWTHNKCICSSGWGHSVNSDKAPWRKCCPSIREKVPLVITSWYNTWCGNEPNQDSMPFYLIVLERRFFSNINIHNWVLLASTFLFTVNYCKTLYICSPLSLCGEGKKLCCKSLYPTLPFARVGKIQVLDFFLSIFLQSIRSLTLWNAL